VASVGRPLIELRRFNRLFSVKPTRLTGDLDVRWLCGRCQVYQCGWKLSRVILREIGLCGGPFAQRGGAKRSACNVFGVSGLCASA
jgi:hypothetical protein